ncbi:MAG: FAD:protein FMN transferase [Sulfurimonas sp.]|nr:FAD:protein FMN transferase [Sulfurimonas sp.]
MKRVSFLLAIFLSLSLHAELEIRTQVVMGTFATIKLSSSDKLLFHNTFTILKRVDNSLSSYKKNSPVYKLNRDKKASINLYTYEALTLSQKYYAQSGGYFNIAIGSITKDLYHFGEDERSPKNWEFNVSDTSFSTLSFDKLSAELGQGVKIDLGGFGKGYGVDRAVEYLRVNGVENGSVALSGDIRCLGVCEMLINNPFSDEALASFMTTQGDIGVSTSGNYNRFVDSVKHNHLINPKTKTSQQNFISITLISTLQNSDLDAYATAASVMPKELAYRFLNSLDVGYIIMEESHKVVVSENIEKFCKNLYVDTRSKKYPEYVDDK